jgi:hypothetical protein
MASLFSNRLDPEVIAPALFAALFLSSGALLSDASLKSGRPDIPPVPPAAVLSGQTVPGRLWEDPFAAAAPEIRRVTGELEGKKADDSTKDVLSPESGSLERLKRGAVAGSAPRSQDPPLILVLPVVVPGGAYAENSEQRLRMRYALLSALAVAGYAPLEPERVGLLWQDLSKFTKPESVQPKLPLQYSAVPFEWIVGGPLDGPKRVYERILVLWVSDLDVPGSRFIDSLGGMIGAVVDTLTLSPDKVKARVAVIGPFDSDDLVALERSLEDPAALPVHLKEATFLSATATISKEDINISLGRAKDRELDLDRVLKFRRTIASDDHLARLLAHELALRGLEVDSRGVLNGRVVLIGEQDTSYSRRLCKTFKEALKAEFHQTDPSRDIEPDDAVDRYTYFRGVDGMGGARAPIAVADPHPVPTIPGLSPSDGRALEHPESVSQFDYLRRLCARIQAEERGRVRAIGIFGTDVYDKLLILQALRPCFPGAVFFTTDLDARLTHPSQYAWTRNLVIASSYDLRLDRDYQVHAPTFRDGYQTSLFVATLRAVGAQLPAKHPSPVLADLDPNRDLGRVYEVARSGHFDLGPAGNPDGLFPPGRPTGPLPTLRDPRAAWGAGAILLLGVSVIGALAPSARLRSGAGPSGRPPWLDPALRVAAWYGALGGTALAAIGIIYFLAHSGGTGQEPFVWFEGISVWPTITFRLIAAALAVVYSVHLLLRWRANIRQISREFELPFGAPSGTAWQQFVRALDDPWICTWRAQAVPSAKEVWGQYRLRGSIPARVFRTLIATLLFVEFTRLTFQAFPPGGGASIRGEAARWWNDTTRWIAPAFVNFLVFLVWDAIRLCDQLVQYLSHAPTLYRKTTLAAAGRRTGFAGVAAANWLDVAIIAARTASVGRAVPYALVTVFILILARNSRFDNWSWSLPSVATLVLSLGITAFSAWTLDRTAATARAREIAQLRERRDRLTHDPISDGVTEILDDLIPPHKGREASGSTVEERARIVLFELGQKAAVGQDAERDRVAPPTDPLAGNGSAQPAGSGSTAVAGTAAGTMLEAKPGASAVGAPSPDPRIAPAIAMLDAAVKAIKKNNEGAFNPLRKRPVVCAIILPVGSVALMGLLEVLLSYL